MQVEGLEVGAFDTPAAGFDGLEFLGGDESADGRQRQSGVVGCLFDVEEELVFKRHAAGWGESLQEGSEVGTHRSKGAGGFRFGCFS